MPPPSPESLIAQGRTRWPTLALPAEGFARYVEERCPTGQDPSTLALADLYLAYGCSLGDAVALALFEREYLPLIERFLARRGQDPSLVDEAKQRLRLRVLVAPPGQPPRIAEFRGQGSLAAWLRVVAAREHAEASRVANAGAVPLADDELPAPAVALLTPEIDADQVRLLPLFRDAFREALAGLPPRDRTLLRLHYIDGLSLDAMGKLYRVNKGTVSRWLAALRSTLHEQVLALLQRSSGASPEETRSLLRLLQSRLELSLRGLRDEAPPGFGSTDPDP